MGEWPAHVPRASQGEAPSLRDDLSPLPPLSPLVWLTSVPQVSHTDSPFGLPASVAGLLRRPFQMGSWLASVALAWFSLLSSPSSLTPRAEQSSSRSPPCPVEAGVWWDLEPSGKGASEAAAGQLPSSGSIPVQRNLEQTGLHASVGMGHTLCPLSLSQCSDRKHPLSWPAPRPPRALAPGAGSTHRSCTGTRVTHLCCRPTSLFPFSCSRVCSADRVFILTLAKLVRGE